MERRIEFTVSDHYWFAMMYPDFAGMLEGPGFKCTYAIREDELGRQYYELLTEDGRTNWNHLTAYEKMCLWDCQSYFDNRLQLVGCPNYCTAMKTSDGFHFAYQMLNG